MGAPSALDLRSRGVAPSQRNLSGMPLRGDKKILKIFQSLGLDQFCVYNCYLLPQNNSSSNHHRIASHYDRLQTTEDPAPKRGCARQ
jgi:hypothetical protein